MPITFSCTCGKSYTVDDALAGKSVRCRVCETQIAVPAVEEPFEDFEVVEEESAPAYSIAAERVPSVAAPADGNQDPVPTQGPHSAAEHDKGATPDYFIAAYEGTLVHLPKLYRIYPDSDGLLVIHAGPFNWWMVDGLKTWSGVRSTAARAGATHGAAVGFGIGLAASVVGIFTGASEARELAKRAAVLDPMPIEQLRTQTVADKASFRLTADTASDVRIYPPSTGIFANRNVQGAIVGNLRFTHRPTGKWDMLLLTKPDAKAAIRTFRNALGKENVAVTLKLKRDEG
ncbi:MAG TPA: hypothetical protein VGG61_03805 [Gemmataceae bacterium]